MNRNVAYTRDQKRNADINMVVNALNKELRSIRRFLVVPPKLAGINEPKSRTYALPMMIESVRNAALRLIEIEGTEGDKG